MNDKPSDVQQPHLAQQYITERETGSILSHSLEKEVIFLGARCHVNQLTCRNSMWWQWVIIGSVWHNKPSRGGRLCQAPRHSTVVLYAIISSLVINLNSVKYVELSVLWYCYGIFSISKIKIQFPWDIIFRETVSHLTSLLVPYAGCKTSTRIKLPLYWACQKVAPKETG